MPEEYQGEKTEQPTPQRRREARERGQVARSTDLNTAVVLLSVFIALALMADLVFSSTKQLNEGVIGSMASVRINMDTLPKYALTGLLYLARFMAPLLGVVVTLALLSNLVQVGVVFTSKPLEPDLNRINPVKGLQRIFSIRSLVRFGMSLTKLLIIGSVLVYTAWGELGNLFSMFESDIETIISYSGYVVFLLGIRTGIVMLLIAILDYLYQRWEMERELKMTRQELKDELKRMEGDPKIRERRKALQRQLAMQRMMAAVPEAEVVITNPTELAVALGYEEDKMNAPQVLAKGADFMAARIREEAAKAGVPIVEKKPLAQAIYKACEVGDDIPPDLYQAVAEVLAYVYEISGRMPRAKVS